MRSSHVGGGGLCKAKDGEGEMENAKCTLSIDDADSSTYERATYESLPRWGEVGFAKQKTERGMKNAE